MKLSLTQVQKVAKLANLTLSDVELQLYSEQLSKILEYIDQLSEVDTDQIEPTFNVTGVSNIFREDKVGVSLTQDQALANSSNTKDGLFITKGVFADE